MEMDATKDMRELYRYEVARILREVPVHELAKANYGEDGCTTFEEIVEEHEAEHEDDREDTAYAMICDASERVREALLAKLDGSLPAAVLSMPADEPVCCPACKDTRVARLVDYDHCYMCGYDWRAIDWSKEPAAAPTMRLLKDGGR